MTPALVIAAPRSGSGKTLTTLGLLRALKRRGLAVGSAKVGPDYIDPAFHAAASGRPCVSLDGWAMRPGLLDTLAAAAAIDRDLLVVEGVMGLFDGANVETGPTGSSAEIAARFGWPVVLVVDVRGQAASVAALLRGFASFDPAVRVAGVIFNNAGSIAHADQLTRACEAACPEVAIIGSLPRLTDLAVPERHLGLVQAGEHADLEAFLERAADQVERHLDLDLLVGLAGRALRPDPLPTFPLPPFGQRIAIARDQAFAFAYDWLLDGWQALGAELLPFSPLADEGPAPQADAVYLPGGYPELHAGVLGNARRFRSGMRAAADHGAVVFGECGGYMALGQGLVDGDGTRHPMLGLLPVETSFAKRKLHLGYRCVTTVADSPFGPAGTALRGHEFHYAGVVEEDPQARLFALTNAAGQPMPAAGQIVGSVLGSFVHIIDRV